MARPTRLHCTSPGVPNHVVLRGNNRRNLFSYSNDRQQFLRLLIRYSKLHACAFHNIALLTNHVHLVVTPQTVEGLSSCIKSISQSYAQYRNGRRKSTGKLFEQRFWSKPMKSDAQMMVVSAYVDLNPIVAGLPNSQRGWTTLGIHSGEGTMGHIPEAAWSPSPWYLALGENPATRAHAYCLWLATYQTRGLETPEEAARVVSSETDRRRVERPDRSSAR
ncbi:MAG: transposase [Myxococcales bacterium]|nr:transposase [Myxococcales bacterium]